MTEVVTEAATDSAPSEQQLDALLALFGARRYVEADAMAAAMTAQFPLHGFCWMARAEAMMNLGRIVEALAPMQTAAKLLSDKADVHNSLGLTFRFLNRLDEACASFLNALWVRPDWVDVHNNLGASLRDMGFLDQAAAAFRHALQYDPGHADAYYNLAIAVGDAGDLEQAVIAYRRALQIKPDYIEVHNNLGNAFLALDCLDEAVSSYRQALLIQSDYADAHDNLGVVYRRQGRLADAEASHLRALKIRPGHAQTHNNLGIVHRDRGQLAEAEASYWRAIAIEPACAGVYNNLGVTLYDQGRLAEAEVSYFKAIALDAGFSEAHSNLGSTLMALGKTGPAEHFLIRAIELAPDAARPLSIALSYLDYRQDDPRFGQLESLFARRQAMPLDERIRLAFAMGRAMEGIGHYERSFFAYEEGNRLYHRDHPVDESGYERFLEKTCGMFTADLFRKFALLAESLPDDQDRRIPVFIVGMPRSGTTLIEQILASHPAVYGAGELTVLGELVRQAERLAFDDANMQATLWALRALGREYLDRVWKLAPDAVYIVDKMPGNYYHAGLIHLMFPHAKIVHAMRDPADTCFSCYALRFTAGYAYSYDLGVLGRTYLRYTRLLAHWHKVLPPGRILDLRYEDNVASPEREARRLLDYLGLEWDAACLQFFESGRSVKTASLTQVRKPIYSSSVARWKHFKQHLGPLLQIIESAAATPQ